MRWEVYANTDGEWKLGLGVVENGGKGEHAIVLWFFRCKRWESRVGSQKNSTKKVWRCADVGMCIMSRRQKRSKQSRSW